MIEYSIDTFIITLLNLYNTIQSFSIPKYTKYKNKNFVLNIKIPHINTLCINNISTLIAPIILEFIYYRLQIFLISLLPSLAPFENNWKQFTNDQKKKEKKKKNGTRQRQLIRLAHSGRRNWQTE